MKRFDERIIGQKAYEVDTYNNTIQELTITGFTVSKEGYQLTYEPDATTSWRKKLFLSKKKAVNFLNNLINEYNRRQAKRLEATKMYNILREAVDNYKHLIGREVVVKTRPNQWTKDTIIDIDVVGRPYREPELCFRTRLGSGAYLFKREGRNWKYWSELDDLLDEKKTLKVKLDNIKNQIAKLDKQIAETTKGEMK